MPRRSPRRRRPGVESLESRLSLSASPSPPRLRAAEIASLAAISPRLSARASRAITASLPSETVATDQAAGRLRLMRITNPTPVNARLVPPFQQVLVQSAAPTPGRQYNVLFVSVRNSTGRELTSSDGLMVRLSGQKNAVPVLTDGQTWAPGDVRVFYVLTKQYYPVNNVVSGGFEFDLGGNARGVAIPGPSGIFLRVIYVPDRFSRTLDGIVAFGPGSRGRQLGLPDTSLWEILPK